MAWTAVITHATGDVFPASDWNTYVRDNLAYLHGDAGAVTINNSVTTAGYLEAVVAAAGNPGVQVYVSGDANARVTLSTNGPSIYFGPGGGTALDTQLYRGGAGVLRTPGSLTVDGSATISGGSLSLAAPIFHAYSSTGGLTVPTTFVPDTNATGDIQRVLVSAGTGTLTVSPPGTTPGAGYSRYLTVIVHNSTGSAVTLSWNAVYTGGPLGSVSAGLTAYNFFVYNPGEAKYQCLLSNMN